MTESRLSGLSLFHIHKDIELDTFEILAEWDRKGNRRITLADLRSLKSIIISSVCSLSLFE